MAKDLGNEQLKGPDGAAIDRLNSDSLDLLQAQYEIEVPLEEWLKAWRSYEVKHLRSHPQKKPTDKEKQD